MHSLPKKIDPGPAPVAERLVGRATRQKASSQWSTGSTPALFLGIDGGGTKTAACVLAGDGTLVDVLQLPGMDYGTEGPRGIEATLRLALRAIEDRNGIAASYLAYAFFGIPGFGESRDECASIQRMPGIIMGHDRYTCGNDMVCGWAGSFACGDGVNVISGTGSMAYGRAGSVEVRVGGWGDSVGDEGSANWIGRQSLQQLTWMLDGRVAAGPLQPLLSQALGLSHPFDLIPRLNRADRADIASLAIVVDRAAGEGDVSASRILDRAAEHLLALARTAVQQLDPTGLADVAVAWSGGVFNSTSILSRFRELAKAANVLIKEPLLSPPVGAALYAARLSSDDLDLDALGAALTKPTSV